MTSLPADRPLNTLTGDEFRSLDRKAITLLGMSGVGKTTLCRKLPSCDWFHYSGDFRLGTRYMDEAILDNIKREAMKVPFLADLLRRDAIYICHNITTTNLSPVSTFLGKIGDPARGGIGIDEFMRRQALHMEAEYKAMLDVEAFIDKAFDVYGYRHFVNDAGGSLCELDDPALFEMLARRTLIIYLEAPADMLDELVERAMKDPKPLYYRPDFLTTRLDEYLRERALSSVNEIEPDDFMRWIFPQLIESRLPRYDAIARRYGIRIDAGKIQNLKSEADVLDLIAAALDR
ncbi:MAG: hypothetical protein DHS20C01_23940 [marine bacterium B5-7]|nr:MAG: hypothetical protein DHS20C01_23940 [marine bacterium B5-7]